MTTDDRKTGLPNADNDIEQLRQSIITAAEKAKKAAYDTGDCAYCGGHMPSSRISHNSYTCSIECSFAFVGKFDYSKNSPILKERRRQLKAARPKNQSSDPSIPLLKTLRTNWTCDMCGIMIKKGEKAYVSRIPPWHWLNEDKAEWYTFKVHPICEDLAGVIADDEGVPAEPDAFREAVFESFADINYEAIIEWSEKYDDNFGDMTGPKHQWIEFLRGQPSDLDGFAVLCTESKDIGLLHLWLNFIESNGERNA